MITDEIKLEQLPRLYETHALPDAISTVIRFDEQS
jgi:hypothetical protein